LVVIWIADPDTDPDPDSAHGKIAFVEVCAVPVLLYSSVFILGSMRGRLS